MAILWDIFGMVIRDLQIGDQQVTLNHLQLNNQKLSTKKNWLNQPTRSLMKSCKKVPVSPGHWKSTQRFGRAENWWFFKATQLGNSLKSPPWKVGSSFLLDQEFAFFSHCLIVFFSPKNSSKRLLSKNLFHRCPEKMQFKYTHPFLTSGLEAFGMPPEM